MAHFQNVLILAVLCVLAGALTQAAAEPHNNREHNHEHNHKDYEPTWITCDFSISPHMRCHDCNTRLICKRIGGLLLDCPSPWAPYCNNGLCSPVPSVECSP